MAIEILVIETGPLGNVLNMCLYTSDTYIHDAMNDTSKEVLCVGGDVIDKTIYHIREYGR